MISSKEIQEKILSHWMDKHHCLYACTNFSMSAIEEMDVMTVNPSLFITEFEIKMSRSDYFADFRKNKHTLFSNGNIQGNLNLLANILPNKFYFCCPSGLIKASELPDYAGLIYFTKFQLKGQAGASINFVIVKKAPFIHRDKCEQSIINRIAKTLSQRFAFGCALMTYRNNKNKEAYAS